MRYFGGLFVLLFVSDVFASEIVRVRLFTTTQKEIRIYEDLKFKRIILTSELKEPLELEANNLQLNADQVPSKVIIYPKNGSVDVIGVLKMEDYLRGVLPHEMPLVWPIEALKAQAVVARSFTKKQMIARKDNPYHLDSTVSDQMYRYSASLNKKEKENLELALKETKDEVLENNQGLAMKALYHADCGGQTEKASQVWGQKEVEFSVKDSLHSSPYSNWEYKISAQDLKEKLKIDFIPQALNISSESLSDRALQMEMVGLSKTEKISSQEFRRLVGYSKLKSTKFQVQKINEEFLFKGSGFGHGVGMCQWGSKSLAKSGMNYKDILKHYFPGYTVSN